MFSADLSWTDNSTEKVGQRRQRRANKRENSISSSTSGSKNDTKETNHLVKSPLGSITKTISFSSVKDSMRRPSTATSLQHRNGSVPALGIMSSFTDLKDPAAQPDYTYAAKLGSRLPSGAIIESPREHHAPEMLALPLRTVHAQQVATWEEPPSELESSPPPARGHRAWSVKTQIEAENICQSYQQVKDEILALQNPDAILPQQEPLYTNVDRLPSCPEYDESCYDSVGRAKPLQGQHAPPDGDYGFMHFREETPKTKYVLPVSGIDPKMELPSIFQNATVASEKTDMNHQIPTDPDRSALKVSQWSAPDNWDIVKSQVQIRTILDSESSNEDGRDEQRHSMFAGTHFQRFVRRMESAGPRIILERLKEEWDAPGDRAMSDELQLEKHLWALTAIQLPSMDRFARSTTAAFPAHPLPPMTPKRRRKLLELDGNLGEVYQLSAIYPNSKIYHLTRSPRSSSIPLPSQAVQHEFGTGSPAESLVSTPLSTAVGILPLPYANASMHHIRSTRLPILVAGSQLPALLAECYRVLKPGGILELRLIDATPERRSMGPLLASWLEDRLLLSLEADFKCTRPATLVPRWAREAGFVPLPLKPSEHAETGHEKSLGSFDSMTKCLRLPAVASNPQSGQRDIVGQVGVLVSRALWKDAWGSYVCDSYDEHWWWESAEIVDECREYNTTFDVATMIVMKTVSMT